MGILEKHGHRRGKRRDESTTPKVGGRKKLFGHIEKETLCLGGEISAILFIGILLLCAVMREG
jgi:hypothetical protein